MGQRASPNSSKTTNEVEEITKLENKLLETITPLSR